MSVDAGERYAKRYAKARGNRAWWRQFLKPGWVIALLFIVAFSYFAFTFLAPWQLGKDRDIVQRNEQIDAAFSTDPVPYDEVFDAAGAFLPGKEWTRVELTGHFLPDQEVVLRMRPVDSSPAIQVLTPFELADGRLVLVHRGWQPTKAAEVPDFAAAPTGEVTLSGVARADEPTPERAPMTEQGHLQVYGINTEQIGQAVGADLGHDYVQLTDGSPGVLIANPIPKLERGSHLSYGFQWIAFGIMAPAGLGYFIWAEIRERRKVRAEEAEMAAGGVAAAAAEPSEPTTGKRAFNDLLWDDDLAAPPPSQQRLVHEHPRDVAHRYGDARPPAQATPRRRDSGEERF